ncbi:MAG: CBS domain-containing protein [Candidatus Methanofastidiosia archaeon]
MKNLFYGKLDRGPVEFGSRIAEREREILKIARKNVVTVPPSTTIKGAAETMTEYDTRRLPIVHPGINTLIGILTTRDVIDFLGGGDKSQLITKKHKGNFLAAINESVREIMSTDVSYITENDSVGTTLKKMVEENVGGFPILNKNRKVMGIVEEEDFVYNIAGIWAGITVEETMTRKVTTLTPGTSISDTSRIMIKNYIRRLPIISDGDLIGIVTTVDILKFFGSSKMLEKMNGPDVEESLHIAISEIMNTKPLTIEPSKDLGKAVQLMKNSKIGCLPVTEDGKLVGIITERDILTKLI